MNHGSLSQFIAHQISEAPQGQISFADFMGFSLYHPDWGYYTRSPDRIGAKGDFLTASSLGADFGELIADEFAALWRSLGQPQGFTIVEMGAGQGWFAADVLSYLWRQQRDFCQALQYWIIEQSPAFMQAQQQRLAPWQSQGLSIAWKSWAEIASQSITGCFFSNELVDAFPVHGVTLVAAETADGAVDKVAASDISGRLQEVYVRAEETATGIQFAEAIGALSTPKLADYFQDLLNIDLQSPQYEIGYRTEVNLAALDWMVQVADRLNRGYVITLDYGYAAAQYYHPNRSQGTLQCYFQHRHHNDPYIHLGEQDITAHVDFTALARQGERCGLETLGFTQQGLFLMALGLGDRLNQISQTEPANTEELQARLQRRDALHQLINPMGLGGFGVLVQGKGLLESEKLLRGLTEARSQL